MSGIVDRVKVDTLRSPNRYIRLRAVSFGINELTVRRIIRWDLPFHPYKTQVYQKLLIRDDQQRTIFHSSRLN